MATKKISINGVEYTEATTDQLKKLGDEKVFVSSDGLKQEDKITFAPDCFFIPMNAIIGGKMREWLALPISILRNGETLQGTISLSMLTGSGYAMPNPEKGLEKNEPFNRMIVEAIKSNNKTNDILSFVKGKTFSINRVDFYQPEKWIETTEKKENGNFKMQPATAIIGEKLKILTTRKTVSQLM